eukprot:CCRYP_017839-RA/>CCRYP_017839-RA protein AED:0.00 eAED:0.00 QI:95/1/0.5/1/0/0/2/0/108
MMCMLTTLRTIANNAASHADSQPVIHISQKMMMTAYNPSLVTMGSGCHSFSVSFQIKLGIFSTRHPVQDLLGREERGGTSNFSFSHLHELVTIQMQLNKQVQSSHIRK